MISHLVYLFVFLVTVVTASSSTCRCISGQECWPTKSDFQVLSSQVSQSLIYPVPTATPCYSTLDPSGNCTEVLLSWNDGNWRSDQSGTTQSPNWETFTDTNGKIEACYHNATLGFPCKQGSVPVVGVDARSSKDIQAAINFASKHNLRLVIKNTGHDYIGRSTAKGSFLIWTHNMKNITFHETFSLDSCQSSVIYDNALTLHSGVQWYEAYAAAAAYNRVIVGGVSPGGSVGSAGGWISGGGHSFLSPSYGLGVDNVLQMTIVIADGSHLTVNKCRYPDLFWALRGGGGGTWGVLTSVTYRTHPSTPFQAATLLVSGTVSSINNVNATQNIFTELIRMTPSLVDQGFGGCTIANSSYFQTTVSSPNATLAQATETFKPLFDYATSQAQAAGLTIQNNIFTFDSFDSVYTQLFSGGIFPGNVEASSLLLPDDVVTSDPESLSVRLMDIPAVSYCLFAGGAVASVDPNLMGLNPAWRKALAYTIAGFTWSDGMSSDEIAAIRANFKLVMAKWNSIAPDSGSYINEASPYEPNWKKSFFGSHYDRLKEIKYKYDPNGLFIVWEGVGSDDWDASLNCRIN